jgi:hypothetical protein
MTGAIVVSCDGRADIDEMDPEPEGEERRGGK